MHDPTSLPAEQKAVADADAPAWLLRAVSSLAHSLAIQIAASAAVTFAVATIPWLHESNPTPAVPPVASTAATATPVSSLQLAGVLPASAFPMEGDARFGLALHRTYRIVADATWSDGTPVDTAGAMRIARHKAPILDETQPAREASLAQTVVAILPPERPLDLGAAAPPRKRSVVAPALPFAEVEPSPGDGLLAQLDWPELPTLELPTLAFPSAGDAARALQARAGEAREAMSRTAGWAAAGVSNALPRF